MSRVSSITPLNLQNNQVEILKTNLISTYLLEQWQIFSKEKLLKQVL